MLYLIAIFLRISSYLFIVTGIVTLLLPVIIETSTQFNLFYLPLALLLMACGYLLTSEIAVRLLILVHKTHPAANSAVKSAVKRWWQLCPFCQGIS